MADILYIVVPCYNEEAVLPETSRRLRAKMEAMVSSGRISERSRVLLVNDGSKDGTWNIIERLHRESPLFSGVNLTRNRGHQNALLAGLMTAKDRVTWRFPWTPTCRMMWTSMDRMVDKYDQGNDVVYGVRSSPQDRHLLQEIYRSGFL